MTIEERIVRHNQEDVVWIGMELEKFYNSDSGTIVRALANAITTKQFIGDDNHISSDRKLGRAEGLALLITDIELAIDDMKRITDEIKENQKLGG